VNCILLIIALLFLPSAVFAGEVSGTGATAHFDLTHHIVGYLSVLFTVLAYVAAMSEEVIELRKSKPMVLGAAIIWFAICIYYALNGQAKVAAVAFESNLLA
jgi:heme/copper-type cytochrome/quinol oxidase subunit 4